MSTIRRSLILVALAIVFLTLIVVGYLAYSKLINATKILKSDLKNKSWELETTENKLSKANQKSISFAAEKESLNKKIAAQKEQVAEILKAKEELEKQQEALSTDKQEAEKALEEAEHLYQEQVNLRKLDVEAIEESFRKKAEKDWKEILAKEKRLEKQIKSSEAKMKESSQENQKLLARLEENDQMILRLRLEKRDEGDQANSLDQEDEQFLREVLKFHYNKAFIYEQSGQYEKALVEYKKALKAGPDDADIHYNLAILYDERLLDKKKAIEHYQIYLKLSPDGEDTNKVNYWIIEAKKELEWQERKLRGK